MRFREIKMLMEAARIQHAEDIIFWEGHVAILVDHLKLIHASGFHGKVLTENIKKTMRRIKGSAYYVVDRIN